MDPESKPIRKPEYRLELVGEDILLYNPSDTKIFSFNPTASIIWRLCDGSISVMEMIEALEETYPEAAEEIPEDVKSTLDQFVELGCIDLL